MDFIRCDLCGLAYEVQDMHSGLHGDLCKECHHMIRRDQHAAWRCTGKFFPFNRWWEWFPQCPACSTKRE